MAEPMMTQACGGSSADDNAQVGLRGKTGDRRDSKHWRKHARPAGSRKDERAAKRRRGF